MRVVQAVRVGVAPARKHGGQADAEKPAGNASAVPASETATAVVGEVVALFRRIAQAEGWQPGGELDAYPDRSVYFALRRTGEAGKQTGKDGVVGGLHLVLPDARGLLPGHRVWPELPVPDPPGSAAHILVLAADGAEPASSGAGEPSPFWHLCAAMWGYCVEQGVRELRLEATPKMLRCYRLLGWPLVVRGELREHWGEPCYPCSLSVREVAGSLAEKAARSRVYRRVLADMVGIRIADG